MRERSRRKPQHAKDVLVASHSADVPILGELAAAVTQRPELSIVREHAADHLATVQAAAALRPFIAALAAADAPLLVVTATEREAEELFAALRALTAVETAYFPSWETLPHERLSPGKETVGARLETLHRILQDPATGQSPRIVVASARGVIQPVSTSAARRAPIRLAVGEACDPVELAHDLDRFAYAREDLVARRGDFAVRGGIVDIFPVTHEYPVRIEFDDDTIAAIREFQVADQRSMTEGELDAITVFPCRELLLEDAVRDKAAALAQAHANNPSLAELLESLAEGIPKEGMEALQSALDPEPLQLLPLLMPQGTRVLVCDPDKVRRRAADLATAGREFLEASWTATTMGADAPLDAADLDLSGSGYRTFSEVREQSLAAEVSWWQLVPQGFLADDSSGELLVVPSHDAPAPRGKEDAFATFFDAARTGVAQGDTYVAVTNSKGSATRLVERAREAELPAQVVEDAQQLPAGVLAVYSGPLVDGFAFAAGADGRSGAEGADSAGGAAGAHALVLLTEAELSGNRVAGRSGGKAKHAKRRNRVDPLALKAGDLVVHDQHGIGRFVEMVERTSRGGAGAGRREYLVIEYASSKRGQPGDRLFVPMEALGQLSRYVGGEAPTLSKMGGADWQNTKRKARKAVREIATELVALYAQRQAAKGHAFGPDTPWQREMEESFPYTETMDQLNAIDDVKGDMEKPVPMDRVIVGDVGYGKTEVAVRAAFKAVQDGKQVAVLVPTTLLAQQHLETFAERMAGFPVKVRGLSRFTSDKEAKEIVRGLAEGTVDIVIGTHRLLATGVRWAKLGLVIVDEEQRFGVEHKEHIKALRNEVDVLTMSATPIPRTLEMSLAGIREMSQILTPPEDRLPVLTYVGAYSDKQVAAAIRRELLREGQVFFVHNRVSSIDATAARLRELVPEARIAVAHGQMGEERLEQTVNGFWNREYDVLVCTTIVETGLDISNANTLIVDRAENLGLSQMHQLRGRVGRSRERGYAYFLFDPSRTLTETAYDRLAVIAQNNELGAGMAVAMKDLEQRGAGNVLGAEQSGHIAGVGFDLYIRLVGEAVEAFRAVADGEAPSGEPEVKEIRIELPVDAYLPAEYVDSERLRLEAYRKLAEAHSVDDIEAVVEELTDRYGPLPEPARRVVSVARLRLVAQSHGVTDVVLAGQRLRISPLTLADSQQLRLKRLYPAAVYKATTHVVQLPLPKAASAPAGAGGHARARDDEILQYVADFLAAMAGEADPVDVIENAPAAAASSTR